jgi:hypothetical protein
MSSPTLKRVFLAIPPAFGGNCLKHQLKGLFMKNTIKIINSYLNHREEKTVSAELLKVEELTFAIFKTDTGFFKLVEFSSGLPVGITFSRRKGEVMEDFRKKVAVFGFLQAVRHALTRCEKLNF